VDQAKNDTGGERIHACGLDRSAKSRQTLGGPSSSVMTTRAKYISDRKAPVFGPAPNHAAGVDRRNRFSKVLLDECAENAPELRNARPARRKRDREERGVKTPGPVVAGKPEYVCIQRHASSGRGDDGPIVATSWHNWWPSRGGRPRPLSHNEIHQPARPYGRDVTHTNRMRGQNQLKRHHVEPTGREDVRQVSTRRRGGVMPHSNTG